MATKATQTHFRGIRPSSQEIAIFAKRPIDCADSVNRWEDYVLVSIQDANGGPSLVLPRLAATAAEDRPSVPSAASLLARLLGRTVAIHDQWSWPPWVIYGDPFTPSLAKLVEW